MPACPPIDASKSAVRPSLSRVSTATTEAA